MIGHVGHARTARGGVERRTAVPTSAAHVLVARTKAHIGGLCITRWAHTNMYCILDTIQAESVDKHAPANVAREM